MVIIAAVAFTVQSTYHMTKQQSPGQLLFGQDMILPISCLDYWIYIRHRKHAQIDKGVVLKNNTIIDYYYRVGDKVMTRNKSAYKYKTPFKCRYEIFQV